MHAQTILSYPVFCKQSLNGLQWFVINSELVTRINRVGIYAALLNHPAFTMGVINPS